MEKAPKDFGIKCTEMPTKTPIISSYNLRGSFKEKAAMQGLLTKTFPTLPSPLHDPG